MQRVTTPCIGFDILPLYATTKTRGHLPRDVLQGET